MKPPFQSDHIPLVIQRQSGFMLQDKWKNAYFPINQKHYISSCLSTTSCNLSQSWTRLIKPNTILTVFLPHSRREIMLTQCWRKNAVWHCCHLRKLQHIDVQANKLWVVATKEKSHHSSMWNYLTVSLLQKKRREASHAVCCAKQVALSLLMTLRKRHVADSVLLRKLYKCHLRLRWL